MNCRPLTPLPSSQNFLLHRLAVTEKWLSCLLLLDPSEGKKCEYFARGVVLPKFCLPWSNEKPPFDNPPPTSFHIPLHTEKDLLPAAMPLDKEIVRREGEELEDFFARGGERVYRKGDPRDPRNTSSYLLGLFLFIRE